MCDVVEVALDLAERLLVGPHQLGDVAVLSPLHARRLLLPLLLQPLVRALDQVVIPQLHVTRLALKLLPQLGDFAILLLRGHAWGGGVRRREYAAQRWPLFHARPPTHPLQRIHKLLVRHLLLLLCNLERALVRLELGLGVALLVLQHLASGLVRWRRLPP